MITIREIELLAPAKNLECGIEAVNHGADAVYIGAPKFGARAAAGNSLDEIRQLVEYAHQFNVRIYVTVNTILHDHELNETEHMIWELHRIGVDALIVQDLGITRLNLPPIPLHGSTQMDNRTVDKVKFLSAAGFRQIVLARELSLEEITRIHQSCPEVALEVFVHGALCVSYSGQCYASQACFGRSANRGECAQFCRLPFSLFDADGKMIEREKHLLSLKDMNRLDDLEQLLDVGVTSLKIEGRLKDVTYVKNVTASYRQRLDAIFSRRKEYVRASSGKCTYSFTPNVDKSFNRGFIDYFLHGRQSDMISPDTPKAMGEVMGTMKEQRGGWISVAGVKPFHNGDGVCYADQDGRLQGFRINRVDGNKLFPAGVVSRILPRTTLYRNFDQEFERLLTRKSAERKIAIEWELTEIKDGFSLTVTDEDDNLVTKSFELPKEKARIPQVKNVETQLSKLGNTIFESVRIKVDADFDWFIPASVLAEWRRQMVDELLLVRRINYKQETAVWKPTTHPYVQTTLTYLGNVLNQEAVSFYQSHGVTSIAPAFEKSTDRNDDVVMFCRFCLRYQMGWCPTHQGGRSPYREPYYLVSKDGKRFKLLFDCKQCQMKVVMVK